MDIEKEIAATMTDSSACLVYQREGLKESHFADSRYAQSFAVGMEYFRTHGKMVEAPSIDVMEHGLNGYSNLTAGVDGASPSYLCEQLKSLFVKRQSEAVLRDVLPEMAKDPTTAALRLRDSMSRIIDSTSRNDSCIEYGADMADYRRMVSERDSRSGAPYPWKEMQTWTGGIRPGEMAVLVGPSGMGKSNIACLTALEAVRQGWNVYFATLELEPLDIAQRIEYMEVNKDSLKVPIRDWTHGVRIAEYEQDMAAAQDAIAALPGKLVIDQPPVEGRTPTALVQECKMRKCNFLIVDQLQFVTKPSKDNLSEAVGLCLQEFKSQIMSPVDNVRLPLLLLHQMNREGVKAQEKGTGHIGTMSDIAHSAWVEQLSDVVWGMGRNKEEENAGLMNLATLKHRRFAKIGWRLTWDLDMSFQIDVQRDGQGRPQTLEDW
jgi:replicative DNA helicase